MSLLYCNDTPGQWPPSWYAATAHASPSHPQLQGATRADAVVVGAGFTGLSAALHLAQEGLEVVLVDAHRVGFGASGRNGGQLGSGQRQDQDNLRKMMGAQAAQLLWDLGEEAKALVHALIAQHQIDCAYRPGVAWLGFGAGETAKMHSYAETMARDYGYDQIQPLDAQAAQALCPSPAYHGGILDMGAGHLHPLNFALGLARAAQQAGVRLYENTAVTQITPGTPARVETARGHILADQVILAANGYLGGLNRQVASRVMPINNFIVATAPLGPRAATVLTRDVAVADTKFVVNYFRLSHDGRLLFGGGESYGDRFPKDIAATVRKPMLQIFPHLADVPIEYAWGGTLAITTKRLPYLARLAPNMWSASGYSGHGVGTATHAGQLIAKAIMGQSAGFDVMARLPVAPFPGGPGLRQPLLALAMSWFALRDRLGF